jgi:hypothetical protein
VRPSSPRRSLSGYEAVRWDLSEVPDSALRPLTEKEAERFLSGR